jgi:hypothetical protein
MHDELVEGLVLAGGYLVEVSSVMAQPRIQARQSNSLV